MSITNPHTNMVLNICVKASLAVHYMILWINLQLIYYVRETSSENKFIPELKLILWNPSKTRIGIYRLEDGNYYNFGPSFIGLAHELLHAADFLNATLDSGLWEYGSTGSYIPNSEKTAGYGENLIRLEHNIPYRIGYETINYERPSNNGRYDTIDFIINMPMLIKQLHQKAVESVFKIK